MLRNDMKDLTEKLDEMNEKLKRGDDILGDIKRLLELVDSLPSPQKIDIAKKLMRLFLEKGIQYSSGEINQWGLVSMVKSANEVYCYYYADESLCLDFIILIGEQLAVKVQIGENDNLEDYQKIIVDILNDFPANAEIALASMKCFANLQANCSQAAISLGSFAPPLSFVEENVNHMEAISSRFPKDETISLIYCRSLAASTFELYAHPNRGMFLRLLRLLENLIKTRKFNVPQDIMDDMKRI